MQILPEPMNILHVSCRFRGSRTCADSSVTRPTATHADLPRTYEQSTCTCTDSSVTRPTATYQVLHVSEPVQIPVVPMFSPVQPPMQIQMYAMQIPVSRPTCAESPRTCAASPELDMLDPLESHRCIRPAHVVVFGPQELQLFSHGTLYF
ncbi:hypothetical protein TNCV_1232231 [Trichonephila clavipes]|nr:hypothetical protein TNCV_1232231 [Trichonephila clavipes]